MLADGKKGSEAAMHSDEQPDNKINEKAWQLSQTL